VNVDVVHRGGTLSDGSDQQSLFLPLSKSFSNLNGVFIMRLVLAIFLPFVVFFTIGRPIAGIICLILQLTLIGWLPAAIWAVYALGQYKTDKKIEKALGAGQRI